MHGFALNLHPEMSFFGMMNPCGITDREVTSVSDLVGRRVTLEEAAEALIPAFAHVFGYSEIESQFAAYARGQGRTSQFEVDRLLAAGTFSPEKRAEEPVLINGRLPGEPERPEWMRVTARMDGDDDRGSAERNHAWAGRAARLTGAGSRCAAPPDVAPERRPRW